MIDRRVSIVSAALVALCLSTVCLAQTATAPPAHQRVIIVHVKPDMQAEWFDLQKNELLPAQKKGGLATRTTYQTMFGNIYEYVTVTPFSKYAEFDAESPVTRGLGAPGAARLLAKLAKCTESRQDFVSSPLPQLSNMTDGPPPPMGVFSRRRVAEGRMQDYENFVKNELVPIYKKANVRYTVVRRGLGANSNDVTSITSVTKMADIDGGNPITRALGPEGAAKLLMKANGISTQVESLVRRRVPELSY